MDELSRLAVKHGTDKYDHHFYTPIYYNYLKELKGAPLILLEIGVGGYDIPNAGGGGLKMWSSFFPKAKIYGIDIYDKSFLDGGNIKTFIGSQTDVDFLFDVIKEIGIPNVIIDDGSHINSHVVKTFEYLFNFLAPEGFYFVEDCHTSYWEELGADGTNFEGGNHSNTTMNFFKRLTDNVNITHCRGRIPMEEKSYTDKISSIHFHKELILIKKNEIYNTST